MTTSRVLSGLVLGGVILALGASAPAATTDHRADAPVSSAAAPDRGGSPQSTADRVADFYGAYIDVLYDSGRGRLADSLRRHYLTATLRQSLARWESTHHKDGVLRAKGVPVAWKAVYGDSGMGHCWTHVTLTWRDSGERVHRTHLAIRSDLDTRLISGVHLDR
ncbi:hypothetical protein [Streptomyces tauricus]